MKPAKSLKIVDECEGVGTKAKLGDIVHVWCSCSFTNGTVLFSSDSDGIYQIRLGDRNAFVALEQGSIGMCKGGRRKVKAPPNLTYYERKVYPDLSDKAVLYYRINLIEITNEWDNTLHIKTSPIYSESTKELEKQFRKLAPSTDLKSEFQIIQNKMFKQAKDEYQRYIDSKLKQSNLEKQEDK